MQGENYKIILTTWTISSKKEVQMMKWILIKAAYYNINYMQAYNSLMSMSIQLC